jgi:hypothetical protein
MALDSNGDPTNLDQNASEDVARIIRVSHSQTRKKLRFFHGSDVANVILYELTNAYVASGSFRAQSARLPINSDELVEGYRGTWSIMRVDWYVLSVVHFSICDEIEDQIPYRELIFFTAVIGDLYQSNDDTKTINDDSDNIHDGLDSIASEIENAHGTNFARACYQGKHEIEHMMCHLFAFPVGFSMFTTEIYSIERQIISDNGSRIR